MITLTVAAADHLKKVFKTNPQHKYVRLGVRGGGCSGFEYSIGLTEETEESWDVSEHHGITVVIDPVSMMYLDGVVVDYIESLEQSGFKFHNPLVRSQCGCGQSFSV